MVVEVARMLMGLAVLLFHKQIADFIFAREVQLAQLLNSRGVNITVPKEATFHNLYFFLGMGVALFSMLKLVTGNV